MNRPDIVNGDDAVTLREARACYFQQFGFREKDYYAKVVHLKLFGSIPVELPNVPSRQRALPYHDVHHILTGYQAVAAKVAIGDVDWWGEAEVAAWEIGHWRTALIQWEVWLINAFALLVGIRSCPGRTFRAFRRGHESRTLYGTPIDNELLDQPIEVLRARLGLDRPIPSTTPWHVVHFVVMALLAVLTVLAAAVFILLPLVTIQALRRAVQRWAS